MFHVEPNYLSHCQAPPQYCAHIPVTPPDAVHGEVPLVQLEHGKVDPSGIVPPCPPVVSVGRNATVYLNPGDHIPFTLILYLSTMTLPPPGYVDTWKVTPVTLSVIYLL